MLETAINLGLIVGGLLGLLLLFSYPKEVAFWGATIAGGYVGTMEWHSLICRHRYG